MTAATIVPHQFLRSDGRRTATANERRILSLLRREPGSRADLSRATGLAAHSITRLVEPLIARGLVVEGAARVAGPGKPALLLHLVGDAAFGVGVSVKTDAVSLVLLDLAGTVRAERQAPLADVALAPAIAQIGAMIGQAIRDAELDPARQIGIGAGITGYFVGDGAALNPPDLLDPWALVPIDRILSEGLNAPVWIDNDGNVAAIGEAILGAGRHAAHFAYLYFAAGFGGGLVIDGQPMRGRNGNAGEFASILPAGWPQPNLEELRRYMVAAGATYPDINAMLADFAMDHPGVDAWLGAMKSSLDLVVSAISATLDPDLIVLGGRLPTTLGTELAKRLAFTNPLRRNRSRPVPRIIASDITVDPAALGAATLPLRAAFFEHDPQV